MNSHGDTISIRGTVYTIVGVANDALSHEEYHVLRSPSDQSLLVCTTDRLDALYVKQHYRANVLILVYCDAVLDLYPS